MKKNGFYSKWLKAFATDVPKAALAKYVKATGTYIWHVFSWELVDKSKYMVGDEAKMAYDKVDKQDALYIDWFRGSCVNALTPELASAAALDQFVEVYVVAPDFSWTYIKTHETMCGPYFMKLG